MDIRLNELLNRLEAPGKPGKALSASEFAELCQLVRNMESAKEPTVQADACLCTRLENGADGCPHWKAWAKCKLNRTA